MSTPNSSPTAADITIREASSAEDIETVRVLLREYAANLNADPDGQHFCLENFELELASLPGSYAPPDGAMLLAFVGGEPAGCVLLQPIKTNRPPQIPEHACEMKRLWVRPQFRGLRLGVTLTQTLIHIAQQQGYTALYLDTVPAVMQAANHIYHRLGFQPVERYRERLTFTATDGSPTQVAFFRLSLATPA